MWMSSMHFSFFLHNSFLAQCINLKLLWFVFYSHNMILLFYITFLMQYCLTLYSTSPTFFMKIFFQKHKSTLACIFNLASRNNNNLHYSSSLYSSVFQFFQKPSNNSSIIWHSWRDLLKRFVTSTTLRNFGKSLLGYTASGLLFPRTMST